MSGGKVFKARQITTAEINTISHKEGELYQDSSTGIPYVSKGGTLQAIPLKLSSGDPVSAGQIDTDNSSARSIIWYKDGYYFGFAIIYIASLYEPLYQTYNTGVNNVGSPLNQWTPSTVVQHVIGNTNSGQVLTRQLKQGTEYKIIYDNTITGENWVRPPSSGDTEVCFPIMFLGAK